MIRSNNDTPKVDSLRDAITTATWRCETELLKELKSTLNLDVTTWKEIASDSASLIDQLRAAGKQPLIDQFLTEYGLSTDEGVQLMRLAEALSRTTDPITANELISDKLMHRNWLSHSGSGHTAVMSFSGRAMHIADHWLRWANNTSSPIGKLIAKIGNASLRWTIRRAIRALSSQFIFSESLASALKRAKEVSYSNYLFSFDMLGEAARTMSDAENYYQAYSDALDQVIRNAKSNDPRNNHGISIKLSALHPRYEYGHSQKVVPEIAEMLLPLMIKARAANVQITIDAEEAERLDISMDVLSTLIAKPELKRWHGMGFVVQAYQRRALPLLNWLETKADELGAPLMIRLVKGAYWDSEIKRAQEMGLESYPVYTRKEMTDLSYLACAKKLLAHPKQFSPQFATHNAHSIAAIQKLAGPGRRIEFQRLFGMGQQLHDLILREPNVISRIYAPVGTQKDLLSYLIRRLLENGANSSFVHKLADPGIDSALLSKDPESAIVKFPTLENQNIPGPRNYLRGKRISAAGWDLSNPHIRTRFERGLKDAEMEEFYSAPCITGKVGIADKILTVEHAKVYNPANFNEMVGQCAKGGKQAADTSVEAASAVFPIWSRTPARERAKMLEAVATLLEQRAEKFHYLAVKEAGKTWGDAVDEVREAVDFCRYYAARAKDQSLAGRSPLGVVICISPWNFPLAIFLGQITAALAAGNTVVAKPAEQTPLIAAAAVQLLHDAGIDPAAVNLVPGDGNIVGEALVSHPDTAAICFTGSTATAKRIATQLAGLDRSLTPLIAETGGINAMIVDSSALLEQTVDVVISSAFQSAGQRCSALRIICVQDDIADAFSELVRGAMLILQVGDPSRIETDVGPVIDDIAKRNIEQHIGQLETSARKIGETPTDNLPNGHFVAPVAFELDQFEDLDREIFGPVLHIVRFHARDKMAMIQKINQNGYGLTLGIQSRIDSIADGMANNAQVGNIYINRNQIGAVVGVQPFGGEGLSGTGPKAGGPLYMPRLSKIGAATETSSSDDHHHTYMAHEASLLGDFQNIIEAGKLAQQRWRSAPDKEERLVAIAAANGPKKSEMLADELNAARAVLPGANTLASPAGETNIYSLHGRGVIVSLLDEPESAARCALRALIAGNGFIQINTANSRADISKLADCATLHSGIKNLIQQVNSVEFDHVLQILQRPAIAAVIVAPGNSNINLIGQAIADRAGAIIPILVPNDQIYRFILEKTITKNIAAAGGDVSLLNY